MKYQRRTMTCGLLDHMYGNVQLGIYYNDKSYFNQIWTEQPFLFDQLNRRLTYTACTYTSDTNVSCSSGNFVDCSLGINFRPDEDK